VNIFALLLAAGGVSLIFSFLTFKFTRWKTVMNKKFWVAKKSSQRAVSAIRFQFSKKKYVGMLVELSLHFSIRYGQLLLNWPIAR